MVASFFFFIVETYEDLSEGRIIKYPSYKPVVSDK